MVGSNGILSSGPLNEKLTYVSLVFGLKQKTVRALSSPSMPGIWHSPPIQCLRFRALACESRLWARHPRLWLRRERVVAVAAQAVAATLHGLDSGPHIFSVIRRTTSPSSCSFAATSHCRHLDVSPPEFMSTTLLTTRSVRVYKDAREADDTVHCGAIGSKVWLS
ncbi:hypothetical protein LIA77_10930 [Sarocladium implicatum]|nr:hypothetical protein LIA77_10930 [Sarocladium implicatum]